jgi:hypothetical protein
MGFPTLSGGLTKTEANAVLSRSFSQRVSSRGHDRLPSGDRLLNQIHPMGDSPRISASLLEFLGATFVSRIT